MSLKLGTTDISGVPTTLINTVNGLASDMVGKADTDLSNVPSSVTNLPPTKLYNFDGQWVSKTETLSTATAVGTYTIDLSSYLPNDNYNYEVEFEVYAKNTTAAAINVTLENKSLQLEDGSSSNPFHAINYFRIIVDSNRQITLKLGKTVNAHTTKTLFYRRIGTNT